MKNKNIYLYVVNKSSGETYPVLVEIDSDKNYILKGYYEWKNRAWNFCHFVDFEGNEIRKINPIKESSLEISIVTLFAFIVNVKFFKEEEEAYKFANKTSKVYLEEAKKVLAEKQEICASCVNLNVLPNIYLMKEE